jgi:Tol biopolymer transport system component
LLFLLAACSPQSAPANTPDAAYLATQIQQGIEQTLAAVTPTPQPTSTPLPTPTALPVQKLAFTSNETGTWQIYTIGSDGSAKARATGNSMVEGTFDYSPDGKYIAFETYLDAEENSEIYRMNSDGSDVTRLTTRKQNDWGPIWSPDGSKILFTSDLGNHNWEIYVMNADGSGLVDLSNSSNFDTDPAWSPDSSRIAYKSSPWINAQDVFDASVNENSYIRVAKTDGSGRMKLPLPESHGSPSAPEWSPDDGSQIAFNCGTTLTETGSDVSISPYQGVCVAAADGTSVTRIYSTKIEVNAAVQYYPDPVWSPDGSRLAFVGRLEDGTTQIFTMNPTGSDLTQLTNSPLEVKSSLSWSPDGKRMLFLTQKGGLLSRRITTYVMNADGTGIAQLLDSSSKNPWPIWLSD